VARAPSGSMSAAAVSADTYDVDALAARLHRHQRDRHPFALLPWEQLDEDERDELRDQVRSVLEVLGAGEPDGAGALDEGRPGTAVFDCRLAELAALRASFGPGAADELLATIALCLGRVVRASEPPVRVADDRFSVWCRDVDETQAHLVADRLRRAVEAPVTIAGVRLALRAEVSFSLVEEVAAGSGGPQISSVGTTSPMNRRSESSAG